MILGELHFSSPLVLLACLAMFVPLILHFLNRASAPVVELPTFRFVRLSAVKTANRRRLENVALLLFRMGAFALLPLALALPFHRSQSSRFGTGGRLALAIVLDNTASMSQSGVGQSLFESAKTQALRLVRGTEAMSSPETTILVVPVGQPPIVSSNVSQVSEQIRALAPTGAETELASAVLRAQELLEKQSSPEKLIYVLTDLQRSSLRPEFLKDIKVPVAVLGLRGSGDNLGIAEVKLSNPIIAAKPIVFNVRLAGRLSSPRNLALKLISDDGRVLHTRDILYTNQVPEPFTFSVTINQPGTFAGHLELSPADALAMDNRWYFSTRVNAPIPVAIASGTSDNRDWSQDPGFFVLAALRSCEWLDVRRAALAADPRKGIAALYVLQWNESDAKIAGPSAGKSDKCVVLFPDADLTSPLAASLGLGKIGKPVLADPPAVVDQIDAVDPLIGELGFKTGVYRQIAVSRYATFTPSAGTMPLLTLSTGDPLLVRRGSVYFFTCPPQMAFSTLPLSPVFPALLTQMAARTVPGDTESTFHAGKTFVLREKRASQLLSPTSQPVADLHTGVNELTLLAPGLYQAGNNTIAVNGDSQMNDLTPLASAELPAGTTAPLLSADSPESLESRLTQLARGRPLWDTILLIVLAVVLAETLLANLRKPGHDGHVIGSSV